MAYTPTDWVDGVTPVDEAHMDKIEQELVRLGSLPAGGADLAYEGDYVPATEYQDGDTVVADGIVWLCVGGPTTTPPDPALWGSLSGGGGGDTGDWVPVDGAVPAGTSILANKLLAGDANPAFQLNGDGHMWWGPGGAGAIDVGLYRSAGTLRTNAEFIGASNIRGGSFVVDNIDAGSKLFFGSALDTNLYRSAANELKTDGRLMVGAGGLGIDPGVGFVGPGNTDFRATGDVYVTSNLAAGKVVLRNLAIGTQVVMQNDGRFDFAAAGAKFTDTNLYRSAAQQLKTDGSLVVDQVLYVGQGLGPGNQSIVVRANGDAGSRVVIRNDGYVLFGDGANPVDAYIYRSAANTLATPGDFKAATVQTTGNVVVGGQFYPQSYIQSNAQAIGGAVLISNAPGDTINRFELTVGGNMRWGDGATPVDTNLYRGAANQLKTDDAFYAMGGLATDGAVSAQSTIWSMDDSGSMWNGVAFGSDQGLKLYRVQAGVLALTGGAFATQTGDVVSRWQAATQVNIGDVGGSAGISFGSAADTKLIRHNARLLGTLDSSLYIGNGGFDTSLNLLPQFGSQFALRVRAGNNGPNDYFNILGDGHMAWGAAAASAVDVHIYRYLAGILAIDPRLQMGTQTNVSGALITAVNGTAPANDIEFGHPNVAGYRSVLGHDPTAGLSYLIFNGEMGATSGTFRTRGQAATILKGGAGAVGSLIVMTTPAMNADNQTPVFTPVAASAFNVSSEAEGKLDLRPFHFTRPMLRKLLDAKPYTYKRSPADTRHLGLLADELPDAAVTGEVGDRFVDLYSLATLTLMAVQRLAARVEALEA